jgi:hypothetical protein
MTADCNPVGERDAVCEQAIFLAALLGIVDNLLAFSHLVTSLILFA